MLILTVENEPYQLNNIPEELKRPDIRATLDYKEGLNEKGFSIDNPNARSTCGCGESFS